MCNKTDTDATITYYNTITKPNKEQRVRCIGAFLRANALLSLLVLWNLRMNNSLIPGWKEVRIPFMAFPIFFVVKPLRRGGETELRKRRNTQPTATKTSKGVKKITHLIFVSDATRAQDVPQVKPHQIQQVWHQWQQLFTTYVILLPGFCPNHQRSFGKFNLGWKSNLQNY